MDHEAIYNKLIEKRRVEVPTGYVERHHIKLRSLGGSNEPENLVKLTAREHYIAHLLIAKFQPCSQTAYALWMMQCGSKTNERPNIQGSRMYEWARKEFAKYMKGHKHAVGKKNSQFGTMWICNIALEENKKIPKNEVLPEGWIKGRSKWKTVIRVCPICRISFIVAMNIDQTFCSASCGRASWKLTDSTKKKISNTLAGKKLSVEHKTKISIGLRKKARLV